MVFDEQRQRVIAAVNHLPMVVTLLPRDELERQMHSDQFPHSEFARQEGTPYGMRREPLLMQHPEQSSRTEAAGRFSKNSS